MEWYWWVLLAVAAAGIGALKLKIFGKWLEARKRRESQIPEEE